MTIDDLIGKPYKIGARGPDAYDCAGLVVELLRRRNIHLGIPDTPTTGDAQLLVMTRILRTRWVDVEQPYRGCVVLFDGGHVGVMLDLYRFIHCAADVGQVCIERIDSPLWRKRFMGYYEYAGSRV